MGSGEGCGPHPGYYAISVNALCGMGWSGVSRGSLTYFQHFKPIARAGYSIYIYHIEKDECDRARTELGWPPLE